jgi:hypothetical protein
MQGLLADLPTNSTSRPWLVGPRNTTKLNHHTCQILESGEDAFVLLNEVTKYYNITMACLHWWANKGEVCILRIRELGKHLYNAKDLKLKIVIVGDCGNGGIHQHRKRITYAHVSSEHQWGDLKHQVGELRWLCPNHKIVTNMARYISQTHQKQQNGPPPRSCLMVIFAQ